MRRDILKTAFEDGVSVAVRTSLDVQEESKTVDICNINVFFFKKSIQYSIEIRANWVEKIQPKMNTWGQLILLAFSRALIDIYM